MAEQAKAPDDADAYRGLLTHYDAKISLFKEIHPYLVWALKQGIFYFVGIMNFLGDRSTSSVKEFMVLISSTLLL